MPFGNRATPGAVRAYEYGVHHIGEGRAEVLAQMRARREYWNRLVEVARAARDEVEALIGTTEPKERKARFADPSVKAQLRLIEAEAYARARLVSKGDLHWCNADDVRIAWTQACRKHRFNLHFHGRDHAETHLMRVKPGIPTHDRALRTDSHLQLHPLTDEAAARLGEKTRARRREILIRVGSDAKRRPLWFRAQVTLHRPLPEGTITRVSLHRTRIATHEEWHAVILVTSPPVARVVPEPRTVSVDVGWRKLPHGLRIATWRGDDGAGGEVILPDRWLQAMRGVDSIQSHRQDQFNEAKRLLAHFLKTAEVPEWFTAETETLGQWRSPGRLARLMLRWRAERFAGDKTIFTRLEGRWDSIAREYTGWRAEEKHHYEYEANSRDKLIQQRLHLYRNVAADLARRYNRVVIEDFRISDVARREPKADFAALSAEERSERAIADRARAYRQRGAPSILVGALKNAFAREYGADAVSRVPCAHSTKICAVCGALETFDAALELIHTCSVCHTRWDQDVNATYNLRRRDVS